MCEPNETKHEKRASTIVTAGLAGLVLAAVSTPIWGPYAYRDKKEPAQPQSAPVHDFRKQRTELVMEFPYRLEIFIQEPEPCWAGARFSVIDEAIKQHWQSFDRAQVIIPELSFVQPFDLKTGAYEVRFTPTPLENRTYHFLIAGYRDKAQELFKYQLNGPAKK